MSRWGRKFKADYSKSKLTYNFTRRNFVLPGSFSARGSVGRLAGGLFSECAGGSAREGKRALSAAPLQNRDTSRAQAKDQEDRIRGDTVVER